MKSLILINWLLGFFFSVVVLVLLALLIFLLICPLPYRLCLKNC